MSQLLICPQHGVFSKICEGCTKARKILERFYADYPELKKWHKEIKTLLEETSAQNSDIT